MAGLAPPVARNAARSAPAAKREPPKTDARPRRVQPKLKVSQPNEPLERSADQAADRVMRSAAPAFPMGAEREPKKAQRKVDETQSPVKQGAKVKRKTKPDDKAHREAKPEKEAHRKARPDKEAHRDAITD